MVNVSEKNTESVKRRQIHRHTHISLKIYIYIYIYIAVGEYSPNSGSENCLQPCVSFITTKFQGRGGGSRATSFRQCSPLSGQTAVWFPVSSASLTASDEKRGLRKGQISVENENAKHHRNPSLPAYSNVNSDGSITY